MFLKTSHDKAFDMMKDYMWTFNLFSDLVLITLLNCIKIVWCRDNRPILKVFNAYISSAFFLNLFYFTSLYRVFVLFLVD